MRCDHCPVPEGLPCYELESHCRRAAQPGEHAFRDMLVKHAKAKAGAPGLFQQSMNFARSVAGHLAAGAPIATPEQQDARLAICRANTCGFHFLDDNDWDRCGECGCVLAVKTTWAESSCPLDPPRWGPVEPTAKDGQTPPHAAPQAPTAHPPQS